MSILDLYPTLISPEPNSGCWIWVGARISTGYGCVRINKKTFTTHRLSWRIKHGHEAPRYVCHTCDVRLCCNPDHLFDGSQADNMQDAKGKGRHKPPPLLRAENHPRSKLTWGDVDLIRNHSESIPKAAARFGVARSLIGDIRNNKRWKEQWRPTNI